MQKDFPFRYSDTNEEEIKCLFGLLCFRVLYHNAKQPAKELWYDRPAISLSRYEWLTRKLTFHDHNTVRADFLEDRFARMTWFLTEFLKNAQKYYWHTEFVVLDETLRNFYAKYN